MRKWILELPITPESLKNAYDVWEGITSRVKKGSNHVTVADIDAEDRDSARRIAVTAANRLLDQLSFHGGVSHQIAFDSRSCKAVDEGTGVRNGIEQPHVSLSLPTTVSARGRVIRKKMDVNGNVVATYDSDKLGKLPGVVTDAMSYYRRGKLSENLYERLRNKCLAIENVVSLICSRDQITIKNETERFQHAFQTIYRDSERAKNVKSIWKGSSEADLDDLGKYVHEQVRCQLTHAKDNKPKRLPYDENDVNAMTRAQDVVDRVAQDLIRYQLAEGLFKES